MACVLRFDEMQRRPSGAFEFKNISVPGFRPLGADYTLGCEFTAAPRLNTHQKNTGQLILQSFFTRTSQNIS
jgi:hypothetical protein